MPYEIALTDNVKFMLQGIQDPRVQREIVERIDGLVVGPEEQGTPVLGELAGSRSISAVEDRYRIIYRVVPTQQIIVVLGIRRKEGMERILNLLRRFLRLGLIGPGS